MCGYFNSKYQTTMTNSLSKPFTSIKAPEMLNKTQSIASSFSEEQSFVKASVSFSPASNLGKGGLLKSRLLYLQHIQQSCHPSHNKMERQNIPSPCVINCKLKGGSLAQRQTCSSCFFAYCSPYARPTLPPPF